MFTFLGYLFTPFILIGTGFGAYYIYNPPGRAKNTN